LSQPPCVERQNAFSLSAPPFRGRALARRRNSIKLRRNLVFVQHRIAWEGAILPPLVLLFICRCRRHRSHVVY